MTTSAAEVVVVCATREDEASFGTATFLGRSLNRFPHQLRPRTSITYSNGTRGLPEPYNEAIALAGEKDTLLFVHDDVYLHDWFTVARVLEALQVWDVVGLAGSSNSDLGQPSWIKAFDETLVPVGIQRAALGSGCVGHHDHVAPLLSYFGPAPASCLLLDGLFLAASARRLRAANVWFDRRFALHLYDLDFCRSAVDAGLTLGTWPISVTHRSTGRYTSKAFRAAAIMYLAKWQARGNR